MAHIGGPETPLGHSPAQEPDSPGAGCVQKGKGRPFTGAHPFLAAFSQYLPHPVCDVAEVYIDGTGGEALVADRAVVGHVVHLLEVTQRHAAAGLLLVQECLHHQPGAEYLVAGGVKQVGPRHMGHAHRLALAAPQAVPHIVV